MGRLSAARPWRSRQALSSSAGTFSSGRGHSAGSAAPLGSASAPIWSIMRGSLRSPGLRSLRRPMRTSPKKPVRRGMPARKGASAAFHLRDMTSAWP